MSETDSKPDLHARLEQLAPEKRRLFEKLLQQKAAQTASSTAAAGEAPPIERVARTPEQLARGLPLSFSQLRLWFLHRLDPANPFYNLPTGVRLRGRLDPVVLARGLAALLERHEALRTAFFDQGGEPYQTIVECPALPWAQIDLARLAPAQREIEVGALAAAEARAPFDLRRAPLLRARLLGLGERDHVLLLTVHHIVSDGWSQGVLVRELITLYVALAERRPSPLPPLPIQYADYAVWQRRWLAGAELERLLGYWRAQLGGLPTLELPTDRARPALQTYRGTTLRRRLPRALHEALQAFAGREGLSPFMVMLAAFQTLLARFSGQDDVVVGSPIANRTQSQLEGLIGLFINTLVLRTRLGGEIDFRTATRRAKETALGAFAHQALPFERLVEDLQPERDLSRNPLFQVLFNLLNTPLGTPAVVFSGLELEPLRARGTTTLFDLSLIVNETPDLLSAGWEHNLDLFDPTTIERFSRGFERLLAAFLARPETRLGEADLLGSAAAQQVLVEHNDTRRAWPGLARIEVLVAARAALVPERIAIAQGESQLSYGVLAARAARLAARLRRAGVGAESRVGVALERSPELLVALLGIWRAGGAYVPLDPSYPRERLAAVIEDAAPRVLVMQPELAGALPEHGAHVVDLARLEDEPPLAAPAGAGFEALAYVLFTSGSTGRPKGVAVPHAALANFLFSMAERPGLAEDDALLALTSLSFDIAGLELYLPLVVGARVELASTEQSADGAALRARLAAARVSVVQATPATWRLLGAAGWAGVSRLRALCGGEALPVDLAAEIAAHTRELWNLYGPTETTVWSAIEPLEGSPPRVTLGRPIANTCIHLADRDLRPLAPGVAGEPLIGGAGVARGYLGRPGLTAERFVPDPWAERAGERLYRTGDLARRLGDGRLEFLGRADHQVKLRGFRIELGEVESALARHPQVAQAVVVLHRGRADDPRLVAFVVAAQPPAPTAEVLRPWLEQRLPGYMVPAVFVALETLPLTPNRKVDRVALMRRPLAAPAAAAPVRTPPRSALEATIAAIWCDVLGVESVGRQDSFFDLGGHSLLLAKVQARLETELGREVKVVDLFRFPTVAALAEHLRPRDRAQEVELGVRARLRRAASGHAEGAVAVVGMALRFPGAETPEELWRNLLGGVESIVQFSDDQLLAAGVDPATLAQPGFVKAGAPIPGIDLFDAGLFGMSPREAEITDPQHRLFLSCAWEALERAACDSATFAGQIGVFAGMGINRYVWHVLSNREVVANAGQFQVILGNDKDFLPTRVSYKLDLKGPSVNVQTACSTSLVATHLACRSLLALECDLALAGGVSVRPEQVTGYTWEEGAIGSPDGHCRAFDARGRGTVGANGVGVVVLRRLEDALRDGDPIQAVILGTAINNDGSGKVGFTAPSVGGQAEVIAEAQGMAGIAPEQIGYVEAHGTATRLGDPIEVAALHQVFGQAEGHRCALGSIKTNLGHLDAAAGAAGLIKATLALASGQIPPNLHFEAPNPEIDFAHGPFFVPTRVESWPAAGTRRAGVSSFGLGGTNAHAVLEQPPEPAPSGPSRGWQLVALSAASEVSLEGACDRLADYLETHPEAVLADVAHTLRVGRRRLAQRRFLVCRDAAEAVRVLRERAPERLLGGVEERHDRPVAFLLPGVGDHYVGMAAELYTGEEVFRATIDRAAEVLAPILGRDLRELLFAAPAATQHEDGLDLRRLLGRTALGTSELDRTLFAQPAVFAVSVALARLLGEWGIVPEAMIGYSLGEYTAACLAGVISFEDGLRLVAERAKLIETLPAGAMLAVPLGEVELAPWLGEELALAATNTPGVSVVSGSAEAVAALESRLAGAEVAAVRLRTSHAFHSPEMAAIAPRLRELLEGVALAPPVIPYLSNVTGTWIEPAQATDPEYWLRHLCGTVRFAEGMAELLADPERILLEVGPGQALATGARQHAARQRPARTQRQSVIASLRDEREARSDLAFLLGALGRLWLAGAAVDWRGFVLREQRRKLVLPTYAFDLRRYWLEPGIIGGAVAARPGALGEGFYAPSWRPAELPPAVPVGPCLLLTDGEGVGEALAAHLRAAGLEVAIVATGAGFAALEGGRYQVAPGRREDCDALLAALAAAGRWPAAIVHLWALGGAPPTNAEQAEARLERSFFSLLALAQALGDGGGELPRLLVVTSGVQSVDGSETIIPEHAAALGPARVIPQELGLVGHAVDVVVPSSEHARRRLAARLAEELAVPERETAVAYRRGRRWVQVFDPQPLEPRPSSALRPGGTYLLLGGLGGIGLAFARELARAGAARLALTVRRDAVGRETAVRELEALGAEVMVVAAEAADAASLEAAVSAVRARFGAIHGVIHAAGIAGQGVAQLKTREQARAVLLPKVVAPRVLDSLFAPGELDFMVLVSSVGSLLGGLGQIDYSAANAVLDAWAHARAGRADAAGLTVALDFGVWKETGLALTVDLPAQFRAEHEAMVRRGLGTEQGVAALRRALERELPQLAVTTGDFQAQLRQSLVLDAAHARHGAAARRSAAHPRPQLATVYAVPRNPTESALAAIWCELLGLEQVGIYDDFFELGGDSLIGTQVLTRVRRLLGAQLTVRDLFESTTVAALAARLAATEPGDELDKVAAIFDDVEAMLDDEIEAELSVRGGANRES